MPEWLDEQVPLVIVLAIVAWVLGAGLIVLGIITGRAGIPEAGLWFSAWGVVLTLGRREQQDARREKAAFELGRRVGSDDGATVRRM